MKRYKIKDWSGLQEKEVVEEKDFIIIPEENIAIRKKDVQDESKIFVDRDFPIYYAIARTTFESYKFHGKYELVRIDTLKTILNGRRMHLVINDRFRDDRFFYDQDKYPLFRAFPMEFGSDSWKIPEIKEKFHCLKGITKVEITDYDPREGRYKMKFIYVPKSEREFEKLYLKCLQDGFSGFSMKAHIIDELDIAEYYIGE